MISIDTVRPKDFCLLSNFFFGTLSTWYHKHLWDLPHSAFVMDNSIVGHLFLVNNDLFLKVILIFVRF